METHLETHLENPPGKSRDRRPGAENAWSVAYLSCYKAPIVGELLRCCVAASQTRNRRIAIVNPPFWVATDASQAATQ